MTEIDRHEMDGDDATARGSTVEFIIRAIKDGIRENRYAPGQRLIEAEITREYAVSRGPVREAMRRLAAEGLVEIEHMRGASVRRLGTDDVVNIFRIREVLEGLAASLAAANIDKGDNRRQLEAIMAQFEAAVSAIDIAEYYRLNEDYHALLTRIGGNHQLETMVGQLYMPAIRLQSRLMLNRELITLSHNEHLQITEAILNGDTGGAEAAMRHHIRRSRLLNTRSEQARTGKIAAL